MPRALVEVMGLQTKPCDPLLRSLLSAPYVSTKSVRLILGISALLAMLVVWVSAPAAAHTSHATVR